MTHQSQLADASIVKIDDDKKLVFGWASIIKDESGKILLDRQDDFIDSEEELEKAAYDYVLRSRDGGEMHIRRGVAKMVESVVFTEEKQRALGIPVGSMPTGWWIGFKVNDSRVWEQVKKGEYAGFSVHGTGKRESTELPIEKVTEIGKHASHDQQTHAGKGGAKGGRRAFKNPEEKARAEKIARGALKQNGIDDGMANLIMTGKAPNELKGIARRFLSSQGFTEGQIREFVGRDTVGKADTKKKKNKIATVMGEFKAGKLKSSSGEPVTDPKQAMAIAISEQKRAKMKKIDIDEIVAMTEELKKHARHNQQSHAGGKKKSRKPNRRAIDESDPRGILNQIGEMGSKAKARGTSGKNLRRYLASEGAKERKRIRREMRKVDILEIVAKTEELKKGDRPGHAFRGNQYTGGRTARYSAQFTPTGKRKGLKVGNKIIRRQKGEDEGAFQLRLQRERDKAAGVNATNPVVPRGD